MSIALNILQIVGARPQIIKSAAIDRAVKNSFIEQISLQTLHTGQHYSDSMSEVFYRELDIAPPDINLNVGSGSHAQQTGAMIKACEKAFKELRPDGIIVYGDTNSTLAAALTGYKMEIPIFHIEAGLRSHDLRMPEETNRICTDHFSTLLFCPTLTSMDELEREGLETSQGPYSIEKPGVFHTGDVMYDNALHYSRLPSEELELVGIDLSAQYIVATIHRAGNTDDAEILKGYLNALAEISEERCPVILTKHPRLSRHQAMMEEFDSMPSLYMIPSVSYLQILSLIKGSIAVITDSGGLQKEAFYLKKPCLVLRNETEWKELVANGNAILCTEGANDVKENLTELLEREMSFPLFYGDGHSAERMCQHIIEYLETC